MTLPTFQHHLGGFFFSFQPAAADAGDSGGAYLTWVQRSGWQQDAAKKAAPEPEAETVSYLKCPTG